MKERKPKKEKFNYNLSNQELLEKMAEPPKEGEREQEVDLITRRILEDKKKKKKLFIKLLFILVLCGLSAFLMWELGKSLGQGDAVSFQHMWQNMNTRYFLFAIGMLVLMLLFETLKYVFLIRVIHGKFMPKTSLKVMLLGKYYDYITPASTGGQPFQVVYLHNKGIPVGKATAVPLVRYFVSMLVWCVFGIVFMIFFPDILKLLPDQGLAKVIKVVAWVSVGCNLLLPIAIIVVSAFPKMGKKPILWFVKIGHKLHLIKNYYAAAYKCIKAVEEYRQALKMLWGKFYNTVILVVICLAEIASTAVFPYFIVVAIGGVEPSVRLAMEIMALNIIVQFATCFIPTPGGTGFAETTFTFVFSGIPLATNVLFWIVLLWRVCTYYIYIVVGIFINIYEVARDYWRAHRERKRWEKES